MERPLRPPRPSRVGSFYAATATPPPVFRASPLRSVTHCNAACMRDCGLLRSSCRCNVRCAARSTGWCHFWRTIFFPSSSKALTIHGTKMLAMHLECCWHTWRWCTLEADGGAAARRIVGGYAALVARLGGLDGSHATLDVLSSDCSWPLPCSGSSRERVIWMWRASPDRHSLSARPVATTTTGRYTSV